MITLLMSLSALAHKPSFGDTFISQDSAYIVEDPNISIVVYQEVTCDTQELWLEFEAEAGFELYVQLGVPVVDWLEDYKPTVAVVAPGLPNDTAVPFDLPEGMGAIVYEAEASPQAFYEPFTQTSSWIWVEERIVLPESGKGYLVGWHENQYTGKMWIATGEVEDFSDVDPIDFIYWDEAVNNFHETGEYEFAEPRQSMSCDPLNAENEEEPQKGCTAVQTNGLGWFSSFFLLAVALRRKQTSSS